MKTEKNVPAAPPVPPVLWRPTGRWHLKTLVVVYLGLAVLFFVVDRFLSRLPEPYRLRDIPTELTPWLKK